MTDEEKEEINKLKEKYQTEFLDDYELRFIFNVIQTQQAEIEKKDKIIDLMARTIDNYDTQLVINTFKNKEHVKEYFINKVEEEN